MRSWRRSKALAIGASTALLAGLTLAGVTGTAAADPPGTAQDDQQGQGDPGSGARLVGPDYNDGKKVSLSKDARRAMKQQRRGFTTQAIEDAQVGDTVQWLALDDINGIYLKDYTLRGLGDHIEIWVADDKAFPEGDCRNALGLTDITDAQVQSFVDEYDTNIFPKESAAFSVAPDRSGSDRQAAVGPGTVSDDQADDTVVLVDNVRDANYYSPDTPAGQTYIAGFFYSVFNQFADRNIMTIDAYDWLHRTGANPPDDTEDAGYQACPYAAGAPRPRLYEGTFAHEYQHLLEFYEDTDESTWVNEGLSDYAQSLVGYVDTSVPVTDPDADSHLGCFSGFLADQGYGGPENSLTAWQDQGPPEILCDYGATYSFMQYLRGHYGADALSALHREDANGLDGLQNVLDAVGSSDTPMEVVHRWAATTALDNVLDGGAKLHRGDAATYSEDSLGFQINWDAVYNDINHDGTPGDLGNEAYSTPGAPPNGSDYVRLQDGSSTLQSPSYFSARDLDSLSFDASGTLPPEPVEWSVDGTPPDTTTEDTTCGSAPDGTDTSAAFYSGCGPSLDRSIVHSVDVPEGNANLTFRTLYDTEQGWDFGFVQVYNNESGSYESVACTDTTEKTAGGAIGTVQNNVPGFSGDSGGWTKQTCDLSAYAGQSVDLAFRYVTDSGVNEAGWWVDDVAVGGTQVSDGSSLDEWQSATQAHPTPVNGFTVQLVAYTEDGKRTQARLGELPVTKGADGDFHGQLSKGRLRRIIGPRAQTVAALVMQDDRSETISQYATYTLSANGVTQPGGGG